MAAWRKCRRGKDTTTGHWEMMGLIVEDPFRTYPNGFPPEVIREYERRIGRKTLGNKAASGTVILDELGEEHMRTGSPIVYTSADSVFQVAAHEEIIPVDELWRICAIARELMRGEHNIGRIIARPFVGPGKGHFKRTANRKDFSVRPTGETVVERAFNAGREVVGLGKIADIFDRVGISREIRTESNSDGMRRTIDLVRESSADFIFTNLVDFDSKYGHRNDPVGYAKALETFDGELAALLSALRQDDFVFITADHGCDPTDVSTDHTREYVPTDRGRPAHPRCAAVGNAHDVRRPGRDDLRSAGALPKRNRRDERPTGVGGGAMKTTRLAVLASFAATLFVATMTAGPARAETAPAVSPARRVADDALVIDRVAEASKRDLPRDLLMRIVDEDIELLRGRKADGTFQYAGWERFEGARVRDAYSIQPRSDRMETVELKGSYVYRVILEIPDRRLVVRKNRPIWIERVDVDYVDEGSVQAKTQSFEVKAWMQPGETRPIDLPAIAREATVKVVATVEPSGGYGNVEVTLIEGRIVDRADSPYAAAVSDLKAVRNALPNDDVASIRTVAKRLGDAARGAAGPTIDPTATAATLPPVARTPDPAARVEMQAELQLIEDLLTGSETERRDGLDRLHQLIRRVRP